MKTKILKLSKIVPYDKNPRDNSAAIKAVKQSIADYGYQKPIVVDKKNVIVMGHTRHKALLELGWEECLVVVSPLSDEQNRQLRIVDNKTSEFAQWDMVKLMSELNEMQNRADLAIYFAGQNLEQLLAGNAVEATPDTTSGNVSDANAALASKVKGWQQGNKENLVEMTCQHCGETFLLDKEEIKRRS